MEETKTIKEFNTTLSSIIIKAIAIFLVWFVWGMYIFNLFIDRWLQENFTIISNKIKENKQTYSQIDNLYKKISTNSWIILEAKKTIKEKYNITVK